VREALVRVAAPAILVTIEVEAVTRLMAIAGSPEEDERLAAWVAERPERACAISAAIADRTRVGGHERQTAWADELRADGGGIVAAVERLLERQAAPSGLP
jgi:hypothetical protein